MAAVSEYTGNNGGVLPSTQAGATAVLTSANTKSITALTYGGAFVAPAGGPTITYGTTASATVATLTSAVFVGGVKCTAANSGTLTTAGASTRNYAIVYSIETTGTPTLQCIGV